MSKLRKALEKAKLTRQGMDDDAVSKPMPSHDGELQITFTRTQVISVDQQLLRKNKVISVFHEDRRTDQLKILRTQIMARLAELKGNCLLVTSANEEEGKTFTSLNLAISIGQELNRTVLLIDADLRPPTKKHKSLSADFLGLNSHPGLSDYLLRRAELPDLLFSPGLDKITMLAGGDPLPNSAEHLGSSRMESLVTEVKARYEHDRIIIIDGPSLLTCTDPLVLSRFVDGILLVVEAEKTSIKDTKRALELLKDRPVLGTLFNKAKQ